MVLRRITADLDTKDIDTILLSVGKALELEPEEIILKPSHSKGYHLTVWKKFKENPTDDELFKLREDLGDDINRVNVDKKREAPKQVFFNKKKVRKSGFPDYSQVPYDR